MIVGRTNKEQEPLSDEEIDSYGIKKVIRILDPMSKTREEVVKSILDGLSEWFPLASSITQEDIDSAVRKTVSRETKLADENSAASRSLANARQRADTVVKEGRFEIFLAATTRFLDLFEFFNSDARLKPKEEFHITLLFVNRSLSKFINCERATDGGDAGSLHDYHAAIRKYTELRNVDVPIKLKYVAKNDRVMAVRVEILDDSVKFFNVIPHISLAKVPEAEFRESNFLIEAVEKWKSEGQDDKSNKGGLSWLDLDDCDPIVGRIRFVRHGSKP
jgi:hypothetical protein